MSLKTVPNGLPYVSRRRVLIDSHNASSNANTNGEEVWDNANFTDDIYEQCSDVVSAELTAYSLSETISAPFPEPQTGSGTWEGARYLDIRIQYLASTLDFSVEMPYVRGYNVSPSNFRTNNAYATLTKISAAIQTAMNALATAPFVTGTVQWIPYDNGFFSDNSQGAYYLAARHSSGTFCTTTYRFASGPNAGNTPYKQLGFDQPIDVGGAPVVLPDFRTATWPIPDRMVNFYQQRYVNVRVDQLQPNFDPFPHARIFLGNPADFVSTAQKPNDRTRLITNGPRRLTKLTVRLTLDQERPINPLYNFGACFTYDILQAVPELEAGAWSTQQSFVY